MNLKQKSFSLLPALCRRQKTISWFLLFVFYTQIAAAAFAAKKTTVAGNYFTPKSKTGFHKLNVNSILPRPVSTNSSQPEAGINLAGRVKKTETVQTQFAPQKLTIGGPGQPEMATFKSVGADNMVSPFTGDFSYNIPLLDVGGYPVNIFYNAGQTMEQEASWVGFGWNLNPGTINRSMRGIPDDFNGEDKVEKEQSFAKDITVGVNASPNKELLGRPIKITKGITGTASVKPNFGITWNNKRGIGLSAGVSGGFNAHKQFKTVSVTDKTTKDTTWKKTWITELGINASINLNSADGFHGSVSPSFKVYQQVVEKKEFERWALKSIGWDTEGLYMEYMKDKYKEWVAHNHNFADGLPPISFSIPSYTPTIQVPHTNLNVLFELKFGKQKKILFNNLSLQGSFSSSFIAARDKKQVKKAYGFMYADAGQDNVDALMDFNRINDGVYSTKVPVISIPVYTYDVFNITGEGTGGSFRAYRGSVGYVKDNKVDSRSYKGSAKVDLGVGDKAKVGVTLGGAFTKSSVRAWDNNNILKENLKFIANNADREGVYFRNPAEMPIIDEAFYNNVGKDKLIRPIFGDEGPRINGLTTIYSATPVLANKYQAFTDELVPEEPLLSVMAENLKKQTRDKRTQVISYLTAEEASRVGVDKVIWAYNENNFITGACRDITKRKAILRYSEQNNDDYYRKSHHISEITVLENDAKRYIYGLPVYTKTQKDVSFSVDYNSTIASHFTPDANNHVVYTPVTDNSIANKSGKEKFFQSQTISNYATSFMLTSILSPDYVDVTGDGITDDDLGTNVKFNYSCANFKNFNSTGSDAHEDFKWRSPATVELNTANFNHGLKTDKVDDKANYSFGSKELWYLHSLESKNMVATFVVSKRNDGMQAINENGGVNSSVCQRRLDRINLYTKADFIKNPNTAKPIKSVFFEYDYSLCGNYVLNDGLPVDKYGQPTGLPGKNVNIKKGKLTLKRIWFTYNGSSRKSGEYVFKYAGDKTIIENGQNTVLNCNPDYNTMQSDRWGNYKPQAENPSYNNEYLSNNDYAFSVQNKQRADAYASAWNLEKILLPSGSLITVNYESDTYAFVQNKRAALATKILGFSPDATTPPSNKLYTSISNPYASTITANCALWDHRFVFLKVNTPIIGGGDALKQQADIKEKYLKDFDNQLLLKLWVKVPKDWKGEGYEPVYVYAAISEGANNCGLWAGDNTNTTIWVELEKTRHGGSPIMQTVVDFARRSLTSKFYPGYDNGEKNAIVQLGKAMWGMHDNLIKASLGFEYQLKLSNRCKEFLTDKSFARLSDGDMQKYGGGHRVKSIIINDNWNKISKIDETTVEKESYYGQEYSYEKTELQGSSEITASSGVTTYEPAIGSEENPFRSILRYETNQPLGPTRYENTEMPLAEAFYPSPMVGYSKVIIKSIGRYGASNILKIKSGVGKQIKEFYTSRDFPVISDFTPFDNSSKRAFKPTVLEKIFQLKQKDLLTLTQGVRVVLNDMNGKPKAEFSHPEGDDKTIINSTEYIYRTVKTGENKYRLNNVVPVIENVTGAVTNKLVGKDVEVMNDSREHYSFTYAGEIPINMDFFTAGNLPIVIPTLFRSFFKDENLYRSFTTLKVVTEFGIIEKIVNNDKGSIVSTENMVYDAETGGVLVSKTNNEFKKPVYNFNYPAHWSEGGMQPAYKNIDVTYDHILFRNGKLEGGTVNMNLFESGDELYVNDHSQAGPVAVPGCNGAGNCDFLTPSSEHRIWAVDLRKDLSNNQAAADFIFIDRYGNPYTGADVYFRIIRSGHRNLNGASLGSIVSQNNPIVSQQLVINNNTNVLNAGAVRIKERWKGQDMFYTKDTLVQAITYAPLFTKTLYPYNDHFTKQYTNLLNPNNVLFQHLPNRGYFVSSHTKNETFPGNYSDHYTTIAKSWMKLDLSSIPQGSTIASAQLFLNSHQNISDGSGHQDDGIFHNSTNPHQIDANVFRGSSTVKVGRMMAQWPQNDNQWEAIFNTNSSYEGTASFGSFSWNTSMPEIVFSSTDGKFNTLKTLVSEMVADYYNPAKQYATAFYMRHDNIGILPQYDNSRFCFTTQGNLPIPNPEEPPIQRTALTVSYYNCNEASTTPPNGQYVSCGVAAATIKLCKSVFTKQFMNPYVQGILGIWRPWRSYVYYGERKENDLTINPANNTTDITKDGVLKDFVPYWNTVNNKLEPTTSVKWVWNSEVAQYNRKGAQLEDHDPLDRYNAAIYGYQETLPIATVNNSRMRLSAFDGFEDYGYKDDACEPACKPAKVHFVTGLTEAQLNKTESHTGKYSYQLSAVTNGQTFSIDIPVSADNTNNEPVIKVDVTKTVYNETIVNPLGTGLTSRYYSSRCPYPEYFHYQSISPQLNFEFSSGSGNQSGNEPFYFPGPSTTNVIKGVSSTYNGKFQVDKTGIYHFHLEYRTFAKVIIKSGSTVVGQLIAGETHGVDCLQHGADIVDMDINLTSGVSYSIEAMYSRYNKGTTAGNLQLYWSKPCDNPNYAELIPSRYFYPEGVTPPTPVIGNGICYSPQQIQATQNATIDGFNLIPGKKMIAGIWVKGSAINSAGNYAGLTVKITNNGADIGSLLPKSRIIEGWQLFEGEFTVPQNTNLLKFEAVAALAGTSFLLDDLRFHPFNANMKSFVFDPQTLRLTSELDENNYASFYEYDDEGTLVRVKKETKDGIKTIKETRSAIQGKIKNID